MKASVDLLHLLLGTTALLLPCCALAQNGTAAKVNAPYPPHAVPRLAGETVKGLPVVTGRIHVDQFGYQPGMAKVAVISDPQTG